MDLESGTWLRDVRYDKSNGEVQSFDQGKPIGPLLGGWRKALLEFSPEQRARIFEVLDVWGQPRAWTDELIASWTVDFIEEQYGQAVVFADCLGAQWTEGVALRARLKNIFPSWPPT